MTKKIMIIDLMNLAFRSYWGFAKNGYLTMDGKPTFLCYGVATAFNFLLREWQPDYVLIAAEGGGQTFRHELFKDYKADRKPPPDDFKSQLPMLWEMIGAYGLKVGKVPGVEADDIIGSAAKQLVAGLEDYQTLIVSGDKDFMQLVDNNTFLIKPSEVGYDKFGAELVAHKFGCRPDQVVDALAIIGDKVDMVPGVAGIGEKGAAALIKSFSNLENIYNNIGNIKPALANKLIKSKEMAFLSKKLVTIDRDVNLGFGLDDCKIDIANALTNENLMSFFKKVGFKSMISETMQESEIPDKFLLL